MSFLSSYVSVCAFHKLSFIYFVYFMRVFNSVCRKFLPIYCTTTRKIKLDLRLNVPERVSVKLWKREREREGALSLSFLHKLSGCGVIKLFAWLCPWPKRERERESIIELILLCILFGAEQIDCSPRNSHFLCIHNIFKGVVCLLL